MADSTWSNPFFNEVSPLVRNELNARAHAYGAQIRSSEPKLARNIWWSYSKVAYAFVRSGKWVLGSSWDSLNFKWNDHGGLSGGLYSPQRFQPRFPLLQEVNVSNEGTAGSLIKADFTFIYYPNKTKEGMDFAKIEEQFCKPGIEIEITIGWSVTANNKQSNRMQFTGIVYNFEWNINADLSYTVKTSVVSKGTLAVGLSADVNMSGPESETEGTSTTTQTAEQKAAADAKKKEIMGTNLSTILDKDMQGMADKALTTIQPNNPSFIDRGHAENTSKIFNYFLLAFPWSDGDNSKPGTPATKGKGFAYVKMGDIANFYNNILMGFKPDANGDFKPDASLKNNIHPEGELVRINANNPILKPRAEDHRWIISSVPQEIIFPAEETCKYGTISPFTAFKPGVDAGNPNLPVPNSVFEDWRYAFSIDTLTGIPKNDWIVNGKNTDAYNIANILVSVTTIKQVYDEIVEKKSTEPAQKSITNFFTELAKKVNYASGDIIQLSVYMREPEENKDGGKGVKAPAIMEIVDTNYALGHPGTDGQPKQVKPYMFRTTIQGAIIKNISMSSKPPAASAAAAYVGTRRDPSVNRDATNANTGKGKASSTEMTNTGIDHIDTTVGPDKEFNDAMTELKAATELLGTSGINQQSTESIRSAVGKIKKVAGNAEGVMKTPDTGKVPDASWMTSTLYPIELTLTIDGIAGLQFGNVITVDVMPKRYFGKLVYVITRIRHSVKDGVWESSIETKARLVPGLYSTIDGVAVPQTELSKYIKK